VIVGVFVDQLCGLRLLRIHLQQALSQGRKIKHNIPILGTGKNIPPKD
jgi:hypothetical protein